MTTEAETGQDHAAPGFTPITSQADLDKIIGKRLAEERAKTEAKYQDYSELKLRAANSQAVAEELDAVRQELESTRQGAARAAISARYSVPEDLLPQGTTEEVEQYAERLATFRAETAPVTPGAGEATDTPPASPSDMIRAAFLSQ